ncbi:hypothetical protein [Anaplasma phagocytophilum]|nr:hypothetical protein [Anaplasma phagocytophilum]
MPVNVYTMVRQVVRLEIAVTASQGTTTGSKADRGFCDQSTM